MCESQVEEIPGKVLHFGFNHQDVEDHFTAHDLPGHIRSKFLEIKAKYEDMAHWLLENTPNCSNQTRAIELLLQSKDAACVALIVMWVQEERDGA